MTALLFPGQGAQEASMCEGVAAMPAFASRYRFVCDAAGTDILDAVARHGERVLHRNLFSSLLTVLVASLSLDAFRAREAAAPEAVAGYSVGQWTALYAAGVVDFEQLVGLIVERARAMDACFEETAGGMSAVIGVREEALERELASLRESGHAVFISNINCVGQYSIAGTLDALDRAEQRISGLRPKKLVRLPVSGAWHCPLLAEAEQRFAAVLARVRLASPRLPVADNVTGGWLPEAPDALRATLAAHLTRPVRWRDCVRTLIAAGSTRLVEVGFGKQLSRFGIFIDRQVEFSTTYD
ncbi:ACP S-malonyltransferase [Burkholderia gladioli]|uniref:ACP S-malonyltransferase n=1 Tax=Burkholderia gladioli TaxID=28095 RepID=UPI00163F0535|nr:ACP S-malonyltransferase [Burkholderia gladioli]